MNWEDTLKLSRQLPNPTKEEYDDLDIDGKRKYHARMARRYQRSDDDTMFRWHYTRYKRMTKDKEYIPPFNPSDIETWPEGKTGKGSHNRGKGMGPRRFIPKIYETKQEYENMSPHEKKKYHSKMKGRAEAGHHPFSSKGDKKALAFHSKMAYRSTTDLPTWYSIAEMEKDKND
jgi:hypothetical protein